MPRYMAATLAGLARNDKRTGKTDSGVWDRSQNDGNRSILVSDSGGKNMFKGIKKSITPTNIMTPSAGVIRKTPLGRSKD